MSRTTKRKKVPHLREETVREQLQGANECLDMVRESLERCGLRMDGCAPMFYSDAIRHLAGILGCAAGMEKRVDVLRHVAEHEAEQLDKEIAALKQIALGVSGGAVPGSGVGP